MSAEQLPPGWSSAKLGEVASWGSGGTPSRSNAALYGGSISWFKTGELGPRQIFKSEETITEEALKVSSAKLFPAGSVALAMYGATIGKVSILGVEAATNQACAVGIPKETITNTAYLYHYLRSQKEAFVEAGQGGAQPNISQTVVKSWPFPVAPLNEQKRIADKLDTVLTRVDAVNSRLARVAPLLKRFRQSVLAAATSGRLTEDWRGGRAVNETWRVIPLGKYVENHDGARVPISETLRTERRGAYPYYGASGVIDTIDGFTHEGKFVLIGEDGANLVTRSKPIAFIATGKIWVNNHAHVLKCKEGASDEYLAYYINSIDLTPYVSGSAQPKLNQKNLNTIPVPVPPTEEQTEIVRRVETLFAFADRLEARLAQAQTAATRLTPALLAKAFRGELVPQDPNDEPAAELLRRLQAERATAPKASAGRGRKAVVHG